jgi:hypothetical protein
MFFHKISDAHYWTESRSQTLTVRDLRLNEFGAWTCNCPGFIARYECAHVKALCAQLYGPSQVISAARVAVKRSLSKGTGLAEIFDYAAPHKATERSKRKQVIIRLDHQGLKCAKCGHINPPLAQICAVCGNLPVEAALEAIA